MQSVFNALPWPNLPVMYKSALDDKRLVGTMQVIKAYKSKKLLDAMRRKNFSLYAVRVVINFSFSSN